VVIEEFMEGEEASFFIVSDGRSVLPLAAAQDHKTVFDGDRGPNTGGMGAYSPAPIVDEAMAGRVMREIVEPVLGAMAREGAPFAGFLFVGLMIDAKGPRVVEFNCRFGDPECQAVLPRLDADLVPVLEAAAQGRGLPSALAWRAEASVCVVMASGGYPGAYRTGVPIEGLDAEGGLSRGRSPLLAEANVFHAGTARRDGAIVTGGGRVLCVQALGADVGEAIARAYAAVERVRFEGAHYRRDIGQKAMERLPGRKAVSPPA
jgi:phosphoribosylamine--glycine ligase